MTITAARALFPAANNLVYLDAAHQTPLAVPVRARLDAFYDTSMNTAGPKADWLAHVEVVRARLANFLKVETDTIAFTKNTSEGANICASGLRWSFGDNVVMLEDEHPNSIVSWRARAHDGVDVRLVPNDLGWADGSTFEPYIDEHTRAIVVSHVLYHSGAIVDVPSVVEIAASTGVPVIVDIMQTVGVLPLNLSELGATAVVSGSHKGLLTPHGVGFLHTTADSDVMDHSHAALASIAGNFSPDAEFSFHADARRFEYGNLNIAGIHALGAGLDLLRAWGPGAVAQHTRQLGALLIDELDDLGVGLVSPRDPARRAPHIYVFDLANTTWPAYLAQRGIRVSGVPGGTRISFGAYNCTDDVERLVTTIRDGLRQRIGTR